LSKHRAPGTLSVSHPWLRKLTAGFSIAILVFTALGGGAVYAINGLGVNIGAIDTSDLNDADRPESAIQTDTSPTNLLIMGSDSRDGEGNDTYGAAGGARSDTTLLVHLYNDRKDAVVISIPRDSFVELAACTRPDGSTTRPYETKFNAAFAFGGPVCTIKTIEKLTNIRINNFVVVDFKAFKTVVDAIGGVEVCLTTPAYDPVIKGRGGSGLNLPAGYSTISGEQALAFVRARETLGDGSDISRIKRQQDFIGSMIRGMTEKGLLTNPQMIYRVLGAITSSIQTNPEFANIEALQNFALSLGGLSPANIKFVTLPFELRGDGNVYWTAETDELWTAIRMDQPWPPVTLAPSPSSSPVSFTNSVGIADPTPAEIDVAVLNATTTVGLGRTAADQLAAKNYQILKVGNSTKRLTVSEILYKTANANDAKVLGAATGITKLTLDNSLVSPVVLLVGSDWKNGRVTTAVKPSASATPSATVTPSPAASPSGSASAFPDVNAGTAASTVCTEGNNRVKK
jgi:LCP family protein required for cell wall assembly